MNDVTITLGGNLPKDDDQNGWLDMASVLGGSRRERAKLRTAIVTYDVQKVTDKTDDGARIAILRIRRVEPIEDEEQKREVDAHQETAYERRTHRGRMAFATLDDTSTEDVSFVDEQIVGVDWSPGEIREITIGSVTVLMTVTSGGFYIAPLGSAPPPDAPYGTWQEYSAETATTMRDVDSDLHVKFRSAMPPSAMDKLSDPAL